MAGRVGAKGMIGACGICPDKYRRNENSLFFHFSVSKRPFFGFYYSECSIFGKD